ncbi:hypothetical protein E4U57_007410 [Claviceps arundinis]|uniref:Uncharacterized protein n=1 Tax=Claviceps arundinis TaxID=1623583 RepID=A0ABQ7PFC1_9HYPO|nr:hypothetical protein E4U57_007410 [Claviceps arundinis]
MGTVISLIMVFVLRRRKKSRASCDASEAETLGSDSGATGSEKSNPTKDGLSRMSSDPFAPFGGRVDKPHYSYRPSTGTFELDGVAIITAVELPATSIPEVPDTAKTAATAPDEASKPDTATTAAGAPDEASEPDIAKTVAAAPDEDFESDTVKTAATAPDEDSEPDTVKTAPDEDSEPDTVTTAAAAPDEASDSDIVETAATAPDEDSEPDIVKTATAAPDEASEPRTAPPTPEPAATLASPSSPQGKITYVNQWNEYKALAAGEASG